MCAMIADLLRIARVGRTVLGHASRYQDLNGGPVFLLLPRRVSGGEKIYWIPQYGGTTRSLLFFL